MFEVNTVSPLDETWEARDRALYAAAGRKSNFSGAGLGQREHGWLVVNFQDALEMQRRLKKIPGVVKSYTREH